VSGSEKPSEGRWKLDKESGERKQATMKTTISLALLIFVAAMPTFAQNATNQTAAVLKEVRPTVAYVSPYYGLPLWDDKGRFVETLSYKDEISILEEGSLWLKIRSKHSNIGYVLRSSVSFEPIHGENERAGDPQKKDTRRPYPMQTPYGPIILFWEGATVNQPSATSSTLKGYVRNNTPFEFNLIQFEFVYLDENGNDLPVCDVPPISEICKFTVFDKAVKNGGIAHLGRPGDVFYPGRPVSPGHKITSFSARFLSATVRPEDENRYPITYAFESKPYEDGDMRISLAVDVSSGIAIEAINKSEGPIEIAWEQSAYINERSESSRLIHSNIRFMNKEQAQPNTVIPPNAKVSEMVFPSDHINSSSEKWTQKPLLPYPLRLDSNVEQIDQLVGKEIRLFMRFIVNEKKVDRTFSLKIIGIGF
jgi:hypothetical protein